MKTYSLKQVMIIALLSCILQALEIVKHLPGAKRIFESTDNFVFEKAIKVTASVVSNIKAEIKQIRQLGGTCLLVITFINTLDFVVTRGHGRFNSNGFFVQSIPCFKNMVAAAANLFRILKPSSIAF